MSQSPDSRPAYGPITRTLQLDEARLVSACAARSSTWREAMAAATSQLTHTSVGRRRDVARMALQSVMGCGTREWRPDPLGLALGDTHLPASRTRGLFAALYCLHTPLLRHALWDLYVPLLDGEGASEGAVTVADWLQWLAANLVACADGSLRRTRETQAAMLRKFGYTSGSPASWPVAQRPDPSVFFAALVGDYRLHRWTTRGRPYVLGPSGPRSVVLVTRDYAAHCIGWAEQRGLVRLARVGPDVDVTFAPGDPVQAAVEVVLSGS